jgi:hypothetical protein
MGFGIYQSSFKLNKANKKFENAQRIKQGLIETWELSRKHFYPEGRRIRYQPTMQIMDDERVLEQ